MTATILATAAGRDSWGGDWSETLEASGNVAYVTNPLWQPGSSFTDRTAQLVVDGSTQMTTEVSQLSVTPRFAIIRYDEERDLDITTGSLALAFQDKGERGQWNASGLAQTDSTVTSELGQTGITNVNFRHEGYSASIGYQYFATERLGWLLQGSGQLTRYNSDAERYGLTGYDYGGIQFGPTWSISERLQGALTLETDRVSPGNGAAEKDYSASVQLKRSLTEQYTWHASAGATRVEVSGSSGVSTSGVFDVGVTWRGERVQWDLSAKRAVLPIGLGLLARQDAAALSVTIAVSEHSTLNLSCNAMRSDPVSLSFYFAPGISLSEQVYGGASWAQAAAEWQYHLSPRWSLSAAYSRAHALNYSINEWANGSQARVGVVWQSGRL